MYCQVVNGKDVSLIVEFKDGALPHHHDIVCIEKRAYEVGAVVWNIRTGRDGSDLSARADGPIVVVQRRADIDGAFS